MLFARTLPTALSQKDVDLEAIGCWLKSEPRVRR
jgi:hypothetical protein